MSHTVPERGKLTDRLITYLTEHAGIGDQGLLVGDADVPSAAGWPGGQPQVASAFVASVTVRTGVANQLHRETVRSRHTSWRCRYSLRTIGAARAQADDGADAVRAAMAAWKPELADGWAVQDVVYEQLGGVERKGANDDFATYEVEDVVDLWLTRAAT